MSKVLYVEDSKDTAEAVKIILINAGLDTTTADCGKACFDVLKTQKFDVILLDIMLPDMSGWDIFERLRMNVDNTKYAFLSAIPVSKERLAELKKEGISDYITKPFKKDDLIRRVKAMFESRNAANTFAKTATEPTSAEVRIRNDIVAGPVNNGVAISEIRASGCVSEYSRLSLAMLKPKRMIIRPPAALKELILMP
jgi:DNA-binding response OmpR family regulator